MIRMGAHLRARLVTDPAPRPFAPTAAATTSSSPRLDLHYKKEKTRQHDIF